MKKIFKALAITAASAAMCIGIGVSAGCSTGVSGTYIGEYHYIGAHTAYVTYGIAVEVTVKNNIITGIKDITNTEAAKSVQTYKDVVDGKEASESTYHEFTSVSPGWETYIAGSEIGYTYWAYPDVDFSTMSTEEQVKYVQEHPLSWYGWTDANSSEWTDHVSWLLDQYIGWSVADVLELNVYTDYGYDVVTVDDGLGVQLNKNTKGEPYGVSYNADISDSGLLISGATQGSGRLLLAVQNALNK